MSIALNKLPRQLLVAGVALAAMNEAFAVNANATANIIVPISIAKVSDLLFGNLIAGTGGTLVVSAADVVTPGGNVSVPGSQAGTRAAAVFTVTGDTTFTYAITLPGAAQTITHTNTTDTMTVDTFTSNPSGTGALTAGTQTLKVGATLNVASGQLAGAYSGSFAVTVAYN